jgi:hypothetical protein
VPAYSYTKVIRERQKLDYSLPNPVISETPFAFMWGVRNTVTGRWVASGVSTNAVKATAEAAANTAADAALANAITPPGGAPQPAGTPEYSAPMGLDSI